jgi:hypothetical protein
VSSLLPSSPCERQARVKRANEPLTAGDESVDASKVFFSRRSAENVPEASNTAAPPDLLPAAPRQRQEREESRASASHRHANSNRVRSDRRAFIHSQVLCLFCRIALELIHQLPAARFDSVRKERGEQSQRLASSRKQQQRPFRPTRTFIHSRELSLFCRTALELIHQLDASYVCQSVCLPFRRR